MKTPLPIIRSAAAVAAALMFSFGCESADDPLQEARKLWLQQRYEEAKPIFEKQLQQNPDNHSLRMEVGKRLAEVEPAAAVTHFTSIPDDSPLAFEAARQVFAIARSVEDEKLQQESLLRMERLQPDDPAVVLSLAEHFYRSMQLQRAEKYARRALQLNDDRAQSWLLLAEILDELGRTAEALEPLQQAWQRDPDSYAIRANLAYAQQFSGSLEAAQEHLDWCLKRRPDDVALLGIQAAVHRAAGRPDQALAVIREATTLDPDHLRNRLLEADLLIYQREGEAAYELLKPLLKSYPQHRPLLAALARAAALSGRRAEAADYQQQIRQLIEAATKRETEQSALQSPDTAGSGD